MVRYSLTVAFITVVAFEIGLLTSNMFLAITTQVLTSILAIPLNNKEIDEDEEIK
ncbi:hypothetical protein [Staphylococcus sp. Marseille-Q6910]|uniref:hypothetical protein n=1 Tax=Staphylococcus sp. Marseille-Q6910 TaxID=2937990 RepID=UPI00203E0EED|nr:hypothetical protein [Staphylococcus sp. Marseille-Q6910]